MPPLIARDDTGRTTGGADGKKPRRVRSPTMIDRDLENDVAKEASPDSATVQVRMSSALKREATAILAAAGFTMSDAFRSFISQVIRDQTVPVGTFRPNAKTVTAMEDARAGRTIKAGRTRATVMANLRAR